MYEEIKKNIIEKFMNNHYLWTCCSNKGTLVADMNKRIPFNVKYPYFSDYEKLEMSLGNDVNIIFNLKWEERPYKNSSGKELVNYRLISIS